jgi:hypothetical protein
LRLKLIPAVVAEWIRVRFFYQEVVGSNPGSAEFFPLFIYFFNETKEKTRKKKMEKIAPTVTRTYAYDLWVKSPLRSHSSPGT